MTRMPRPAISLARLAATALVMAFVVGTLVAPTRASAATSYSDGFEGVNTWKGFEEVVGGNTCYGTGIGDVQTATGAGVGGSRSLRVTANAAGSPKSNHLIAHKPVAASPIPGRAVYRVYARQEAAGAGRLGETGPEISLQSTRRLSTGTFVTTVAGIQYLTNPFSPTNGTWAVWQDNGGRPGWQPMLTQPIQRGTWYLLRLEADFATGRYVRFTIQGGGLTRSVNLSGATLGSENKGFLTEATELTLESENAWSNCGQAAPTTFAVNYDNVVFSAS